MHLDLEEILLVGQQLPKRDLRLFVLVHREKAVLRRDRRRGPLFGIRVASGVKKDTWLIRVRVLG